MRPLLVALVTVLLTLSLSGQTSAPANQPVYDPADGVRLPRVTKQVYVSYSAYAMRKKVSGTIRLTCIVSSEGTTRDVKLVRGMDQEMDVAAVAALKQWTFEPGQRQGQPVAVRIIVDMAFTRR